MAERLVDFYRGPAVAHLPGPTLYTYHPDRLRETKAFEDLLIEFPRLTVETLTDETDEHTCGICWSGYQTSYANGTAGPVVDQGEQPVKTPCGHVFGHRCLNRWLPYNSCPACRRPLLDGFVSRSGLFIVAQEDAGLIRDIAIAGSLMMGLGLQDSHRSSLRCIPEMSRGGHIHIYNMHLPRTNNITPATTDQADDSDASSQATEEDTAATPPLTRRPAHTTAGATELPSPSVPTISVEQDISNSRHWLRAEIRRVGARREYFIYQELLARGANLPPPRTFGAVLGENLDWVQDRALFEYIRDQGGFDYPGMDEVYRSAPALRGVPLSDAEIYDTMRDLGMRWQPYGAWESASGVVVFASARRNGHVQAEMWDEVLEAEARDHDVGAERPGFGGNVDGETQGNANAEVPERRGGSRLRDVFRGFSLFRRNRDRPQGAIRVDVPPSGRVRRRARRMQQDFNALALDNGTWAADYELAE